MVERLESREMLSMSLSADGWTVVAPASDTRVVYVSSSAGSDTNDGLSPDHPVQSIPRGTSLLRNGSADWMLLKCGDVWHSDLGTWRKSGRSNQEPMLIGSYGSGERPLLMTGTEPGFFAGASSNTQIDHIAIQGIHFYADGRDPNSPTFVKPVDTTGINILTKTDGIFIEDCRIEGYAEDINLQAFFGPVSNAMVRRNVIDDAYATTTHSQGLYAYGVTNLLIEGNVFDHNGMNAQVPGADPNWYNHNCYISSNNVNCVVRDNIFAYAAGYGLQARSGGDVENNLFINDPVGMSFGLVNGSHTTPGGVSGIVNGNVFLGGGNIGNIPGGSGLTLGNTRVGYPTVVSNNIFSHGIDHAAAALTLTFGIGQIDPQDSAGLNDLNIENNIVNDWYRGVHVDSGFTPGGTGLTALNNVTIRQNDFQGIAGAVVAHDSPLDAAQVHWIDNRYSRDTPSLMMGQKKVSFKQWTGADSKGGFSAQAAYVDPARTIESYDAAVGGPALAADFLAHARTQSKQNWQPSYTAASVIGYVRAGFEETGAAPRNWLPPTPPTVTGTSFPGVVLDKDGTLTFTVTYTDDKAIDPASFASGNVTLIAPHYAATAQLVAVGGEGAQMTATYSAPAPRGTFHAGGRFKFTLRMNGGQVKDSEGFAAQAGAVGTFKVRVARRPKPPTVAGVKLVNRGQGIAVRFSADVSAGLTVNNMVLQAEDGQMVDPWLMTLSWDARHNTATWAFAGEPGGCLPAGRWRVRLVAGGVVDLGGRPLDGNRDGIGGDDYVSPKVIVSKGIQPLSGATR
ncbi:MAG: hypothetical protein JWN51_240 [Phycisphaerales bacterium]|nr:hypothetical protein [Phycisphaerales bacterium]